MNSQDDPEARIRELERSMQDQARTSELTSSSTEASGPHYGYVPPAEPYGQTYPPPPTPTFNPGSFDPPPTAPFGAPFHPVVRSASSRFSVGWLLFAVFAIVGIAVAGGIWAAFSNVDHAVRSVPSFSVPSVPGFPAPTPNEPSTPTTVGTGEDVTVSGVDERRSFVCAGGEVTVSGVSNVVTITGHCAKVTTSGSRNRIEVDAADVIVASGVGNRVTYHLDSPAIENTGIENVVDRR